jgi:hypothetical protein
VANFFDQFDQTTGAAVAEQPANFFDQFDAPVQGGQPASAPAAPDMSSLRELSPEERARTGMLYEEPGLATAPPEGDVTDPFTGETASKEPAVKSETIRNWLNSIGEIGETEPTKPDPVSDRINKAIADRVAGLTSEQFLSTLPEYWVPGVAEAQGLQGLSDLPETYREARQKFEQGDYPAAAETIAGGAIDAFTNALMLGHRALPIGGGRENAIPESSAGSVLQREPEETGGPGGERGRVEPGVQREETAPTGAEAKGNFFDQFDERPSLAPPEGELMFQPEEPPPVEWNAPSEEEFFAGEPQPPSGNGESRAQTGGMPPSEPPPVVEGQQGGGGISAGVSHESLAAAGLEPERGEGRTWQDSVANGRQLLNQGADPELAARRLQGETSRDPVDDADVIRAQRERLAEDVERARAARDADPQNPDLQRQYVQAQAAEASFVKRAVKPLGTMWHQIGMGLQGEARINTSTFDGLARIAREQLGRPLEPGEEFKLRKAEADQRAAAERTVDSAKQVLDSVRRQSKRRMSFDELRNDLGNVVKDAFKDCVI